MDIHQSQKYGQYMEKIGWMVKEANGCQVFIRQFPLIGSFIKIQRPTFPIPFKKIEKIAKKYRAFKIIIEPQAKPLLQRKRAKETPRTVARRDPSEVEELASEIPSTTKQLKKFGYKKSNSPYLPTKTIHLDLTQPEQKILSQMEKKTRNTICRARKNKIVVKQSKNIQSFIQLKARYFWPLPFLITKEIKALWQTFYPKGGSLLLAHHPNYGRQSPLAGVLLLFHQKTAHYWLAASTKRGKELFAPTHLVWEALKLAKKRGSKIFDFQGIYDPRFHQATKSWQGFTRFKKGFGGKEVEYPGCFLKYFVSRF